MRALLVLLHRWFSLAAALFLFVAGATGAVISWDHALDAWLNPQLYLARSASQPLAPLALAARVEQADPRVRVSFMALAVLPGQTFSASAAPRVNPAPGADILGSGSAGDSVMQTMFPLHSGRIVGLPGQVLMSPMGLLVTMLCVTGVLVWPRERRAQLVLRRSVSRPSATARRAISPV